MMVVSCPIKQDFIIECLEKCEDYKFKYEGKQGINMKFSVDCDDMEAAVKAAKAAIKATDVGSVLYFQVSIAS